MARSIFSTYHSGSGEYPQWILANGINEDLIGQILAKKEQVVIAEIERIEGRTATDEDYYNLFILLTSTVVEDPAPPNSTISVESVGYKGVVMGEIKVSMKGDVVFTPATVAAKQPIKTNHTSPKFWIKATSILFWASFLFWIAENMYFGWNATAKSIHETWCDNAVNYGIVTALLVRIETVCQYVIKNHINLHNEAND